MSIVNASELKNGMRTNLKKNVFHIYVVECTKTTGEFAGGRHITVRKNISPRALWSLLKVGARNPDWSGLVHQSIRAAGDEAVGLSLQDSHHKITRVATYTSKVEAQEVAAKMIESNAEAIRALNAARPAAGADPNFGWESEEESKRMRNAQLKAKKARKPAKPSEQPSA